MGHITLLEVTLLSVKGSRDFCIGRPMSMASFGCFTRRLCEFLEI